MVQFTDVFKEYAKDTDFDFIFSVLKKYKMTGFYNTLENLLVYFFEDKHTDKACEKTALYIFTSETTGDSMLNMANYNGMQKLIYFSKIWFPSAKVLESRYPVLKKAPVLLPFCWIKRGFDSVFINRSSLKGHIDEIRTLNSNKYKSIKKTRQQATKEK